jgi:uncharacterized protein Yka (UPF0111/DUF47 family)
MSEGNNSVLTKIVGRVFPKMPNFFAALNSQCDLAVAATDALVKFMETGDEQWALKVRELEHEGDRVKDANMDTLNSAFATPMDREELYRAISTIDHIINYAKTTVREMEVLGVKPDAYTAEMATFLRDGAESLQAGYKVLETEPAAAESHAQAARKSERNIEKCYRRGLAELFDVEADVERLDAMEGHTGTHALQQVMDVMKKREVYRHMANAGDRVARAGEALRDIVVKLV